MWIDQSDVELFLNKIYMVKVQGWCFFFFFSNNQSIILLGSWILIENEWEIKKEERIC